MTEKFPQLKTNEVALVMAEINTGHVLDEHLRLATTNDQKVYTVFSSLKDAVNYAKEFIAQNSGVECNIYGSENNFLLRIDK